ncbi:MAG: UDP-N-acetylglucosamine 1-carboxyvinyltransferase [Patescibacteria group bacterium]|nr:UDP-N-acetylglucosamine 1-carboxyvinyltransferase [Patescibacteria group bacterium]
MENNYIIQGGRPLKGEVRLSGAKNVSLKVIIAALLFSHEVVIKNVPRIRDIFELLSLIKNLGGKAEFIEKNTVKINGQTINKNKIDFLAASKIRVSFMFFAPLLFRFKECYIPNPGGCRIGARPIDRIVEGMKKLGVMVDYNSETGFYWARLAKKIGGYYSFTKPSHTGTELLILFSCLATEKIILDNCALEPEVDELINFLNLGGAKIKREGKKIFIDPISRLKTDKFFVIDSDRNEAITYASLALASKGEVIIYPIFPSKIDFFLQKTKEIGGGLEIINNEKIRFFWKNELKSSKIETSPHPGFMTDWQPNWAVIMTQAKGESIIIERVFENRFSYVEELKKLGAKIEFFDLKVKNPEKYFFFNVFGNKKLNQAIRILGPTKLHSGVLHIADLRAGASVVLAALIANGESVIKNVSVLERGYEDLVLKIKKLGGIIKKV